MDIFLFSDDLELLNLWEKSLSKHSPKVIYDANDLNDLKDSILVTNSSTDNFCDNILRTLIRDGNKILILDRLPTFGKAKKLFSIGINGYGNAIMSSIYLHSAVETINNNLIWLIPDLASELIMQISNINTNASTLDNIPDILTSKEQEIVQLILKGDSNHRISQKLGISINTVKTHIKHIYEKLNVKDKISLTLLLKG